MGDQDQRQGQDFMTDDDPNDAALRQQFLGELPREEYIEETAQLKKLRSHVRKILCRYPDLKIKDGSEIHIDHYTEEQLETIIQNFMTDLQPRRGIPAADIVINVLGTAVDRLIPGFKHECQGDKELKQDIEYELTYWLGVLSNRINIVFRLANNAYVAVEKERERVIHEELNNFNPNPPKDGTGEKRTAAQQEDPNPQPRKRGRPVGTQEVTPPQ